MGEQPVLKHGDMVISEVSAICRYSADRFPGAGLAPASTPRAAAHISSGTFLHRLHRTRRNPQGDGMARRAAKNFGLGQLR
jgi:glutathione S-transferase